VLFTGRLWELLIIAHELILFIAQGRESALPGLLSAGAGSCPATKGSVEGLLL
jgi:hypothetical protein